jgi:hypothetical protein
LGAHRRTSNSRRGSFLSRAAPALPDRTHGGLLVALEPHADRPLECEHAGRQVLPGPQLECDRRGGWVDLVWFGLPADEAP